MRQIVLDTETTGLEVSRGHRIIEIGAVELIDRKLTGLHFHKYLNPEREVDDGAFEVHGLSNEFLSDKPLFSSIADELIEFLGGSQVVMHNASFDQAFIDNEFRLIKKHIQNYQATAIFWIHWLWLVTNILARKMILTPYVGDMV